MGDIIEDADVGDLERLRKDAGFGLLSSQTVIEEHAGVAQEWFATLSQ
jgi:hypothetical protein